MTQLSDHQLLDRFRADHDRAALDALVRRYIDLVYFAAIRQVRDVHLAEDITQAVFIVLVRQARSIRADAILAAWLFTVTRHAASNAIRVRNRQRHHERQKMLQNSRQSQASDVSPAELHESLDDAIASLPSVERNSILLHYFASQTHKQVGQSLGMSEEAARKRVSRGLERLRAAFGAGVENAMSSQIAPAGLIGSTINIAFLSSTIAPAGTSTAAMIAQGVSKMIAISKIKVATTVAAAVLLAGGVASPIISHVIRASALNGANAIVSSTITEVIAPATQPTGDDKFTVNVADDTHVKFLGVSKYPPDADSWTALDGTPIECPDPRLSQSHVMAQPAPEYVVAANVDKAESTVLRMHSPSSTTSAVIQMSDGNDSIIALAFSNDGGKKTAKVEMGVSVGAWNTVAANEKPADETSLDVPDLGNITIHAIEAEGDLVSITIDMPVTDIPTQISVVDEKGTEHKSENINVRSDGQSQIVTCKFDVPQDRVKKILFQSRPFSKIVDAEDISLEKGTITHPKISVRDTKDGK